MSSKKKKFEQQIQQNKINRVTNKNAKYNKKMSKSDENYIKGNYTKSVNQTVYGVKKNLAEGQKVSGYGDDYIDTKGMKRSRYVKKQKGENPYEAKYAYQTGKPKYVKGGTKADGTKYDGFYSNKRLLKDYEKESYKNTGTLNNKEYMPKQKYALMSSHKWDNAEKFSDHLNTKVWDGIETAKANQRKGKHISNALEYVKGGAKDVILDPAMDFVKTLGAIGGYTVSGIAGLKTDLDNSISALTDTKRTLKDYTGGKSAFVENIKDNKKTLDKIGFGLDFAHYYKKDKERADKLIEQEFKDKGKTDELNKFKKFNKDNEKLIQNSLNVAGFVSDIIMPTPIEDKMVDVVKGFGKNTVKSFKELKNGTANLATGIVPEETAKLMANSKKYAGKGNKTTGISDDVFYSGKKGKTAIDKLLDNQFEKTMDNVKDVVKKNPNTSNLGKFLDTLDNKPLKGTQRSIDGRTLNKKYTQTKDGYIPNLMNNVDEIDDVAKEFAQSQQFSMFGKDGSMNAYIDNIQNPYAKYEKVINKYGDDVEGLVNKIDSMSPHNADATLDYLRKTRPEVYEQVVKGSDEITDMIESTTRRRGYETQQKIKDDNKYFNTKDVNTPKFSSEELAKQKYIKENNYKLLKDVFNPKFVDNVGNIKEREGLLRTGVKNFAQKVSTLAGGSLEEASVQIKNAKYLVNKGEIGAHEVSKMLNDLFFDGKDVVRRNVTPRHANQLLDYVDDMIIKQANGVLEEFDSLGNKIPVGEGARKISASLTDYRYDEKMSNLASNFGVKNKAELTNRYKELQAKKRIQPLNTDEFYEYKELGEKIAKWDDEYKKVKYMSDEYDDYAKKVYGKKDGTEGYKEALDELADSGKNKRLSYEEFVTQQNTSKTALDKTLDSKEWKKEVNKRWKEYNLDLDGATDERNLELVRGEKMRNQLREGASSSKNNNVGQNSRARQEMLDDVGEHSIPKYTTQDLQKMKDIQKRAETIRKALNLPETKPMKVKLTKGQKLGDLPPVRENLAHLKKTIQKEIRYMFENPDKYEHFEEGFKHIKQGYVNTLRGYGVPDDKYFHKVKALQDELKGKMNDILKGGTKNTPLLKMELQKLASRVDETFKGFDDVVLDKIDNVNIKTFDDVVTDLNKTDNPFDKLLNDNPFDALDDFDEDALMNGDVLPNNDEVVTISDFFKKLDKNKVDDKPIKEMTRDKRPIPSPSDLINLGMSKDEAFEAINKMMSGEMEIPDLKYEKKVGKGGYTRYERKGIDLSNPSDDIVRKPLDYSTVPRTQKELDVINRDNAIRERKRIGNVDKIEFELDTTPLPKLTEPNAPNMSNYDNKYLQSVLKNGTNEEKRIARRLLKNRGIDVPKQNTPLTKLANETVEETPVKFEDFLKEKNIGTDDVVEQFAKGEEEIYGRALTKGEIKANQQKLEKPKYKDNELYDMYKSWLNSYKKGLTVYNPGWHVQNFFQNKGQNYLALGADALLPQTEARNILKQINGKGGKNGVIKNVKTNQTYSYDEIGKLAQELGVVDGLGEDVRNARGIFPRFENQIDNSPIMKWLETNEQTARLNHFVKQIERGMSPEDASKSVNKYLFDYSKKNKVDDFMGDFVDPFWTFHKNNAKLMYGSMFEHPGKINSIIRGTNGLETGVPEEQRQNEEFKYGKIQKPYANLTDSVNGDQYNYLYKQNMFPDVEDAIPFEREDIENKMNPLVRMLIQQSRGEGNFGNKIVEEGEKPGWNEITMEQRAKEVLMDLNPFMPNLVKTLDSEKNRQQKADEGKQSQEITDKQILMDWINYITGNKGNWYRNLDL